MDDKFLKTKHRLAFSAVMGLFLTISLFIYGPVSLYMTSSEDMWFSFNSLLIPVVIVSAAAFTLITLGMTLFKGGFHKIICCLVFGISLGLYIQGRFFNISYGSGVLDGSVINWQDYTTYGAIDSAMWAACLALPFAFYMVFKKQWRHILMVAAAFVMLIQIAGLALTIYQNQTSLTKMTHEVTKEGIYELSEEENTLVFVLGSMDQGYFDSYKKAHPEYKEELEGFTEYNNTLASGSGSIISFPAMMTGDIYKKDIRYNDFIENMWDKKNVFTLLDDNDVDARIYSDEIYFSDDAAYKIKNVVDRVQDLDSYATISSTMYRYTLFNYMPHYLKRFFVMNTSEFSTYSGNSTYQPNNDSGFYTDYNRNGFTYTDDYKSAVRVYYLKGANTPYRLTSEGKSNIKGTSAKESVEGTLSSIFSMLSDLKKAGKYENANIIIVGDHGASQLGQHPMLLYKAAKSADEYRVSDAPVSLSDLPSTLASSVTDRYPSYGSGKTFQDTEQSASGRVRYFYLNAGSNADSRVEEYKCTASASDSSTMTLMNNFYVNGGVVENYTLGEQLKFTTDETAAIYCTEGFGHTNGWRTLLRGPHGQMVIPIKSIPDNVPDLHVYFDTLSVVEETDCVIKVNGKTVFNRPLDSSIKKNGLNFRVPVSVIGNDNTLTIDFSFPKISEKEMELDANERTIIMSFTSFKIYYQ